MIAFASLFLGMVFGTHPVEVLVSAEVASVEIQLDGAMVGRLHGKPWRLTCDFGELEPHELVAIAYDAKSRELNRVRQWINLPQPAAEIGVVLERHAESGVRTAYLRWESTVGVDPVAIEVSVDGEPLTFSDPRAIRLPGLDEREIHFLRVRLDFGQGVVAIEELSFGGPFSDQAAGEMTAILVRSKRHLEPSDLDGLLQADDKKLTVIGVEQGPAEVIVVVDRAIFENEVPNLVKQYFRPIGMSPTQRRRRFQDNNHRAVQDRMRQVLRLGKHETFRLMWPVPERQSSSSGSYEVFSASPPTDDGLLFLLASVDVQHLQEGDQRLADAVAAAGRTASHNHHRRAVVLHLSSRSHDSSRLSARRVRHYLAKLQVPLHVWWPGKKVPEETIWGPAVPTPSIRGFENAGRRLQKDLDDQWIVWVADLHLPHRVSLAEGDHGLSMIDDRPEPSESELR